MPNIIVPNEWLSKLSKQDQITELNNTVRCTLKPSPVAGIGVFALRHIRKGDLCYCRPNMIPKFYNIPYASLTGLLPEIRELVLDRWASVVNNSLFCSPNDEQHLLMFINHSCNPNYDVASDTALRNIEENEELFEDYRLMTNWEKVRPLNKNSWLNAQPVQSSLSTKNTQGVMTVILNIKNWLKSWIPALK